MRRRLLVVSSVHPPDDPRIREKLIRTLASDWEVAYATQQPGPADLDGIEWIPLSGTRPQRWLAALRLVISRPTDVLVVHDPELLPIAVATRAVRRIPVVLDLHENLPAQMETRPATPHWARRPLAVSTGWVLRSAERMLTITLAEAGYRSLFRRDHLVFANYPVPEALPDPAESDGSVVYVGDVSEARGALVLVEAVARLRPGPELVMVGRYPDELGTRLRAMAAGLGVDLRLTGWRSHPEAMRVAARAGVAVSPLLDLPNYRSSLPTKILEYLEIGVPVVASDLPGTRAAVGDLPGVTLVPPGDAPALAGEVQRALAQPSQRDEARDNIDSVRSSFAWPAAAVKRFYAGLRAG